MNVEVVFELPLDDETCSRMIELARGVGFPRLSVTIEIEPDLQQAPADGMTHEAIGGFLAGQSVAELEDEIRALGGDARVSARVYTEMPV